MEWTERKVETPDMPPGTRTLVCALVNGDELMAVCSQAQGAYMLHVGYSAAAVCRVCGEPEEGHGHKGEIPPWKAHGYLPRLARWPTIEEAWDAMDRLVPKGKVLVAAFISQVEHETDATVRVLQFQEAAVAAPQARRRFDG